MKNNDVLIWGEIVDGGLDPKTLELMGIGRKLADVINGKLLLLLMGGNLSDICEKVDTFGADRIFSLGGSDYESFNADIYVEAVWRFCKSGKPGIFLMAHSVRAMEIAPRLSAKFNTILTTDCIGLDIDPEDGLMRCTKPIDGGNAEAVNKYAALPQMVTVRGGVFSPAIPVSEKSPIIKVIIGLSEFDRKTLSLEKGEYIRKQQVND